MQLKQPLIKAIISAGKLYEVGGAVRDALLEDKPPSKDIDYLVTGVPYNQLCEILREFGRVDLVGRSFGVIKYTQSSNGSCAGGTFDFVLPRKEISTGTAHRDFDVNFDYTLSVEDDLIRRDFTINAIARELISGEFVDPLNGKADLKAQLIRYTSAASFEEDPLRMLRAIQFAARFEFEIEPETYQAICDNIALIETVAEERIAEELNKLLLRARKPSIGFKLMQKTGMLKLLLPELEAGVGVEQPGPYHKHHVFEHSIFTVDAASPRLCLRMAALLHDVTKPQAKRVVEGGATFYGHEASGARIATEILQRLRYSNDFSEEVSTLIERHMFTTEVGDKGMRRLIRKVGQELIFDLLDLRRADVIAQGMGGTTADVDEFEQRIRDEIERKPPFSLADLAVNGHDIMEEFSLIEGERVGDILNYLLEFVLDYPEKNDHDTLIGEAKKYLNE